MKTIADLAKLDRHTLDDAIEEHTECLHELIRGLPKARRAVREAEQELTRIKAQCTTWYKEQAVINRGKITAAEIDAKAEEDEDYQEALADYNEHVERRDQIENDRDIMDARERAIRNMITLYQASYWSMPSKPNSAPRAVANPHRKFKRS